MAEAATERPLWAARKRCANAKMAVRAIPVPNAKMTGLPNWQNDFAKRNRLQVSINSVE
jgi:hypothetical protein